MIKTLKRIGIIATGDELINGDILNTNSQYFRQQLVANDMTPGAEILVSDNLDEITQAISYLLQTHDTVITIGGLGPTSDDRTRFGLAKAIEKELVFNEQAWQWIVDLLRSKDLDIPETNRQQALLPEDSEAIFNANGTACACYVEHNSKAVFMLPGPPNECRPIFDNIVMEKLSRKNYSHPSFKKNWLLFGVSESDIASQLEPLMQDFPECELGFRVSSPYLEVKLFSQQQNKIENLSKKFLKLIAEKIVSETRQTASQQLLLLINKSKHTINIRDNATGGLLEHTFSKPRNYGHLKFNKQSSEDKFDLTITIDGLNDYWQGIEDYKRLPLHITIAQNNTTKTIEKTVPNRGDKTLPYAIEMVSLVVMDEVFLSSTNT